MRYLIQNIQLIQDRKKQEAEILIDQGRIAAMTPPGQMKPLQDAIIIDGQGRYASHGFIDIHTHGGGGHDYMDGTPEAYLGAAKLHASHGTTGLLPTTLAGSREELLATFQVYESVKDQTEGARFLGLHLEGPYLSPAQSGAQDPAYIRKPDPEEYHMLVEACPDIRRWTIAPELEGAFTMAEYLRQHNITPSMGHTDATYDQVVEAVRHGFSHVTHLYSATSTIVRKGGYRFPGVTESAYLLEDLSVEIIADGCHLPAPLLQMVYRFIGPDRTTMVTDSMRGAGMPDGESILGSLAHGQKVWIEEGVAKLMDRSAFAGSVATTDRLVRTMITLAGVPLPVAVDMMTRIPARMVGLDQQYGRLQEGSPADLILFDDSIRIALTMIDGKIVYQA